jgi:hypothetical protein
MKTLKKTPIHVLLRSTLNDIKERGFYTNKFKIRPRIRKNKCTHLYTLSATETVHYMVLLKRISTTNGEIIVALTA